MLDKAVVQRHLLELEWIVATLRGLQRMKGVDAARMHQALQTHLDDFETFAQHIQRYLDRQPG